MDRLFQTFNNISVANFAELSACVFSWLEEHCKPQVNNNEHLSCIPHSEYINVDQNIIIIFSDFKRNSNICTTTTQQSD